MRSNILLYFLTIFLVTFCFVSCGKKDDACDTIVCLNNGTCNNGVCDCAAGFVGDHCENQVCGSAFCQNDGVCVNGVCDCPEGYLGDFCETVTPCAALNCPEHASCVMQPNQVLACECDDWYSGSQCTEARKAYYYSAYSATESCGSGLFTNFVSIDSGTGGVATFNLIGPTPFGSNNVAVSAQLVATDYNKFTIPEQTVSLNPTATIVSTSTGTRDPATGSLSISYKLTLNGAIENCNLTLSK
ncbi:MAG: calcium-binding EGF-like domain-containing protein [Chitinophagales bacterium]|nr:calcium-binding EGF-like domain-containing protein [Chitinophagales bacterium]